MSFLNYMGFLFLLAIPVIVLLYLLKLKRQKVVIPSLILWQRSVQDLLANRPFQKLRANIFLLLQILIVLLLAAAIARPILLKQPLKKRTVVLVMDRSASMKARDENGKSRLENAKRMALDSISRLRRNDVAMLIVFDANANVVQGFTNDKKLLKQRVEQLEATDSNSQIQETLSIISSVYKTNEELEVILLSDGRIKDLEEFQGALPEIEYVKVGDSDYNVGFTEFSVRRNFESPFDFELFVRLANSSARTLSPQVELYLEDEAVDIKEVELGPGEAVPLIFNVTSAEPRRVTIRHNLEDALAVDNVLYGMLPEFRSTKILLVTNGNYFLERAITTNPHYEVKVEKPGESEDTTSYDLVIYDSYSPPETAKVSSLYFNCQPPGEAIRFTGESENALIIDADYQHPIMQYTKMENVVITKCKQFEVAEGVKVLAETEQSPTIVLHEGDRVKTLVVGFDLYNSDFPLKASFPIFISNAVQFLSGNYLDTQKYTLSTREAIAIAKEDEEKEVQLRTPDEQLHKLEFYGAAQTKFTSTKMVGFYQLLRGTEPVTTYGVNLVSSSESDIKAAEKIEVGGKEVLGMKMVKEANIEIWPYFIWLALFVLLIEWLLYWRKMTL